MLKQLVKHQLTLSMTECPRVNKFKFGWPRSDNLHSPPMGQLTEKSS
jgi:hypothetical protein